MQRALIVLSVMTVLVPRLVQAADGPASSGIAGLETKKPGETVQLGGNAVTIKEFRMLPLVQNDYSRRYVFDFQGNPKLDQLRQQEKLASVVAGGKDEFSRQVLLLDWVNHRFKKFGQPTADPHGALEILKAVDAGNTFFCAHYAHVLVSAAASLGWVDRPMSLRLGNKLHAKAEGGTEHAITEIWSNQYGKWVMFDPTFALYVEKNGVPLTAWEIRKEWFYGDANLLDFVMDAKRTKYKMKDMPVLRARYAGFGDLSLSTQVFDEYAHLAYVPNTNLMDAGVDYGAMFITKDSLADGIKWHIRDNPKDPASEPYFPINQAAIKLVPIGELSLDYTLETLMPNFGGFRYRLNGGEWSPPAATPIVAVSKAQPLSASRAEGRWNLHSGSNTLEVVAVNTFGVEGTPSKVVLEVAAK